MAYFVRKTKKNGRDYLTIYDGVYSRESHSVRQHYIKSLGYLDELKKEFTDPIGHFTAEAKKMEAAERKRLERKAAERIPEGNATYKSLGYFPLKRMWDELKMDQPFRDLERCEPTHFGFDPAKVFESLLYLQVLSPGSKIDAYTNKLPMLFGEYSYSKEQMYRALEYFGEHDSLIAEYTRKKIDAVYRYDLKTGYFDCTNYYCEIDEEDGLGGLRAKGPSKENFKGPIVGLGLLLDGAGIPLAHKLYRGNQSEKPEMDKIIEDMRAELQPKAKLVRVADKGLNCASNIYKALEKGDGYIFSSSVKGADDMTKKWVKNPNGYSELKDESGNVVYKEKSDVVDREYQIKDGDSRVIGEFTARQKQIVFWSRDFADKSKIEREREIFRLLKDPKTFKSIERRELGHAAKYVTVEAAKTQDGEYQRVDAIQEELDMEKIKSDEELDGYYLIVTSETKMSDDEVIDRYRCLWEIEESFMITKSILSARPFFLRKGEAIQGHFLICFTALLFLRLIQKRKLGNAINAGSLASTMRLMNVVKGADGRWIASKKDKNFPFLSKAYRASLDIHYWDEERIRKLFLS